MAVKLTAAGLGSLGPGDHADDMVPKLVLRVRASGARSWAVRYSYRGADRRLTLGDVKLKPTDEGLTLKAARDEALAVLARVAKGEDPQAERVAARRAPAPVAAVTVAELCREVMAHMELRDATRREMQRTVDVEIIPAFGTWPAPAVSRRAVRAWTEAKAASAPAMANRMFSYLRSIFAVGVERDLVETIPFAGLRKPSRERSSERVLSLAELWALQRALDDSKTDAGDLVRLLLLTGVRRSMAQNAVASEFEGLDTKDPRWVIPAARCKAKRPHIVPLSPQALRIVKRRVKKGKLFRYHGKAWNSHINETLRERLNEHLGQEAPPWTLHNIRHTIATRMREDLRVRRDVVSMTLSHAVREGPAATGIYDRAQLLPERRDALERWANHVESLPKPGKLLLGTDWGRS
jgi:integrase